MKRVVGVATAVSSNVSSEGVILTLGAVPLPEEPSGLVVAHTLIDGFINFTAGAGTTAIVLRVRRGSLAGTLVGVALTHALAATASASVAFSADDNPLTSPAPTVSQIYVVTVQQTGGTGAGVTNYAVVTGTTS